MEFLIGGVAGMGATIFTNPFDVTKTRLQLQGETQHKFYHGTLHAMGVIARKEGIFALQKGLISALLFQMIFNSVRLGMFQMCEERGWLLNDEGKVSTLRIALCGGMTGMLATAASSPAYLVKTHIQSAAHKSIAVGDQHEHKGTWDAFRTIYRRGGIPGLFQGTQAAAYRTLIGSSVQLTSFSWCKQQFSEKEMLSDSHMLVAFLSSISSSVFTTLAANPMDVVSTRLYNQKSGVPKYKGLVDGLVKVMSTEGVLGLYSGVVPQYLRVGTQTMLSLTLWDKLKELI